MLESEMGRRKERHARREKKIAKKNMAPALSSDGRWHEELIKSND